MALPEREETTRDWLREQLRQQSFCGSPKCDPVQPAADHGPDTRAGVGSILRPDRDRSRKYCQGRKCGTRHRSTNGPSIRRNLPCQVRRSAPRAMGTASRPSTPSLSARWFRRPKRRPRAVGAPSLINGRWRPSRFRPLSREPAPGSWRGLPPEEAADHRAKGEGHAEREDNLHHERMGLTVDLPAKARASLSRPVHRGGQPRLEVRLSHRDPLAQPGQSAPRFRHEDAR
jgi:hypothetical protein